jgi:allantoinase
MPNSVKADFILDVLIQGDIILPDRVLTDGMIGISDGLIAGIFEAGAVPSCRDRIDARGKFVLPGAIDAHVHCFSSLQEGFVYATRSAAAGGVTTLIDMPYDAGAPVVSADVLLKKRKRLEKEARIPDGELLDAFRLVKETGLPIGVHAENDEIVKTESFRERSLASTDPLSHSRSRPKVAESEAVLRALEFAYATGVRLHIYHVSHPRIFDLVDWYREQGLKVSAETCIHYLTLNETDLLKLGAKAKVNPPLRTESDRNGLWQLCTAGRVDFITSDHAPWEIERKQKENIFDNAAGMPGVEMLLPIIYSEGVAKGKITINDLVRLVSENPARIFDLFPGKGQIRPGADADLVILDPEVKWAVDESKQHSTAGWSPYNGRAIQGKIVRTFVRGETVYDGTVIVVEPGFGKFVEPDKNKQGKPISHVID